MFFHYISTLVFQLYNPRLNVLCCHLERGTESTDQPLNRPILREETDATFGGIQKDIAQITAAVTELAYQSKTT
jgi:hypothetical protein